MPEKSEGCPLKICQGPEPFGLVLLEETDPPVKHGVGDPEACAQLFNSPQMEDVFADDTQNKEKAVGAVGDQGVSQDSMGPPAAPAPDPGNPDSLTNRAAADKIKDITLITGKADTAAPAPAEGAGFLLRLESIRLLLIEAGRRIFYTN